MTSNLELSIHRARVADMARFAEQRRTVHAIRPSRPRLIRVPHGGLLAAGQRPQREALGGAK